MKSDSARAFLSEVKVGIEGENITATVSSNLAESTLRQERDLVEFLRKEFRKQELSLLIKVEKNANGADAAPARATPLNDKEKLLLMRKANPDVQVFWEKFGLGLEEER